MRTAFVALLLAAASVPALAQVLPAGDGGIDEAAPRSQMPRAPAPRSDQARRAPAPMVQSVRGACGADGICDEFQVLRRDRVAGPPQATLFRIETRSFTPSTRAEGGKLQESYVLCSPTKPAFITSNFQGEGYTAIFLAPLTPEEYDTSLDGYVVYFEACHGRGADIAEGRAHLADKLGYTALAEHAQPVRLNRPEDVLAGVWDDVATGSVIPRPVVSK